MAKTDIGPRVGIDGEKEFRKALTSIGQQLRTLDTEMKAVTSAFDENDKSQENLAQQSDVLTRKLSLQEQRISEIQKALDYARQNYDENSDEVQRWQQVMNRATADLNKTRNQLSKLESEMGSASSATEKLTDEINNQQEELESLKSAYSSVVLESGKNSKQAKELSGQIKTLSASLARNQQTLKDAESAADRYDKALGETVSTSDKLSTASVAMGNLIANGISAAVSAIGDLVSSLWNMDEATEEYRKAQGRLNTAYEAAGYSAKTAQQAYSAFYGILGDTDTATEASQLLAQLAENEEDVATWADIAAGVSGTFGDSLPIEGLIEASNETAKVGTVTGVLADALNWVGISEDEFNKKLAACSSESERNQLIMQTLSGQYEEASAAFYRNNEALVESRDAQQSLQDSMARVGEAISGVKTELLTQFAPVIEQVSGKVADFISNLDMKAVSKKIEDFVNFLIDNGPTIISTISGIGAGFLAWKVTGIIQTLITSLGALVPALTGATTAQTGLNTAMAANPIGAVITIIATLITTLITLWNTNEDFRNAVTTAWESIKSVVSTVVNAIVGFFTETIPSAFESIIGFFTVTVPQAIQSFVDSVGAFFTETIPAFFQSVVQWFADLPEEIAYYLGLIIGKLISWGAEAITWVQTEVPKIIENIVVFFSELPGKILEFLTTAITNFSQWIANLHQKAATIGAEVIDTIVKFFSELPGKLWKWLQDSIAKVGNFITNMGTKIRTEVPKITESFLGFFRELPQKILGIGKNIVNGLWNGIKSAWSNLINKVTGLFGSLVKGIKDGLGIHSPSKVFAGIGENMAKGLGVGWDDTISGVSDQIQASVPTVTVPDVGGSQNILSAAVSGSGNLRIEVPVNINGKELYRITLNDLVSALNNTARASGRGQLAY